MTFAEFNALCAKVEPPPGWSKERSFVGGSRYVTLTHPRPFVGFVTLDLVQRAWRGGMSYTGPSHTIANRRGRGWVERLTQAAVAWLDAPARTIK